MKIVRKQEKEHYHHIIMVSALYYEVEAHRYLLSHWFFEINQTEHLNLSFKVLM